ncbi:MAG TPA: hypothetical protein VGQ06_01330 [Gemmatimonadales bacterium]|nr:hypothetical protein [Gemmatimonadales bacterium]
MNRALLLICAAGVVAPPLAAQTHWEISLGASGAREIVRSRTRGDTTERLSGLLLAGEAVVTRGRFVGRLRYGEARLSADTGALVMPRNVAEGEALLGYQARPWLTLAVGPHARTYYGTALGDQRWLFWSGRVSARGTLFPDRLESFVELWQAFAGSGGPVGASATGRGAEAGLELRFSKQPFWGRLAYRIEQGRLDDGRRETVEALTLTIGYLPLR